MEYILVSLVLAAVFAFIAYPILNPPKVEGQQPNALDTLIAQRDSTYQAIRDLDFDYQLGKLSTDDYQVLRERYKARAAVLLGQIDAEQGTDGQSARPSKGESRCGNCGTPYEPNDQFCRRCGNRLN